MFSGIIDRIGRIESCRATAGGKVLAISAAGYWAGTPIGASIAIDGVCLTLTDLRSEVASFDAITESLRRSTLGDLRPGDAVNLQKSLAVGDRIDGHFVQGHVDAVGTVARIEQSPQESIWWFAADAEAMAYIIPKGSIAIDGISLTIAAVRDPPPGGFSVALIPTTLERTTLGRKTTGGRVNIETDILARTIVHYLRVQAAQANRGPGPLTLDNLREHGFA
jgi:riboflavin synthase alpha subunit